jgi:hypothetical protein
MITAIIIISLAYGYLLYETKGLSIRLQTGKDIDLDSDSDSGYVKSNNDYLLHNNDYADNDKERNPNPPITKPVIFTPLDMPELQGTINIGYKRV